MAVLLPPDRGEGVVLVQLLTGRSWTTTSPVFYNTTYMGRHRG